MYNVFVAPRYVNCSITVFSISLYSAVGAGDVLGTFLGKIWANVGEIWAKLIKIWANLIRFGQNQNLASLKTLDLPRLCLYIRKSSRLSLPKLLLTQLGMLVPSVVEFKS